MRHVMRCQKCKKPALRKGFCRSCFSQVLDKRVKKNLRKRLVRGMKILIIGDLADYYIHKLVKMDLDMASRNILAYNRLSKKSMISSKRFFNDLKIYDLIVFEWSLDDDIDYCLRCIFKGLNPPKFPKKVVRLFQNISDDDLSYIAKIHNIEFSIKKRTRFHDIIGRLEVSYPEIRHSLKASMDFMDSL